MSSHTPTSPTSEDFDAATAATPEVDPLASISPEAETAPATAAPRTAAPVTVDEWAAPGLPARYGMSVLGSALLTAATLLFIPFDHALWRALLTLATGAPGLALLLLAGLRQPLPQWWRRAYPHLRGALLALAYLLALCVLVVFTGIAYLVLRYPTADAYFSDVLSLTDTGARLLLAGHNPYTGDAAFRGALARFPTAFGTPMRGHAFGLGDDHPSPVAIAATQRRYLADPARYGDAFVPASLHSYPALAVLLYVPLLWAGVGNILILHLLVYAGLFAWLVWQTPVGWRHWGALVAAGAFPAIVGSLILNNEVISITLLLAAWHLRERRGWLSALLLGLACAYKQYAWFFAPFFALDALAAWGWRATLRWALVAAGAFLLPNLPFLLASPRAWLESQLLPMKLPVFPQGLGIISLSTGHLLPYGPPWLYAALEVAALAVALWLFARSRARLGDAALILALLPLYFAFRSTANYFSFAPWLALYAANGLYAAYVPIAARHSPLLRLAARLSARWRPGTLAE
jgi:hypothetical protein